MACFNWAVKRGKMIESPLWGMERGRYERRERILTPEEKQKIKAVVKGGMSDFLFCLEQTGARPFSEVAKVTASMIDWQEGTVTFSQHKNKKKGKTRVIYLTPDLSKKLKELARERPEGPLLLTRNGRQWTRQAATKAMRRIEKKAGVHRLMIYAWRHTFITDCLAKGMSPTIIGRLVGNSARTIARFYDHVEQRKDALREAAKQAVS
jgi:integrase